MMKNRRGDNCFYKLYIKNLEIDLEQNVHEKPSDWSNAEKMAKETLDEWKILINLIG